MYLPERSATDSGAPLLPPLPGPAVPSAPPAGVGPSTTEPAGTTDPPRPPRRRSAARRWVALVAVVAAVAGGVAAVRFWPTSLPEPWLTSADLPTVTTVIEDVDPGEVIPVATEVDPAEVTRPEEAVQVYLDPELTVPAPDAVIRSTGEGFEVAPADGDSWAGQAASVLDPVGGRWGFADHYFIAELLDAQGEPREEPVVTAFTVRTALPAPELVYTVDEAGIGQLTWAAVPDATEYRVLRYSDGVLVSAGRAAGTAWSTDAKTDAATITTTAELRSAEQNSAFAVYQFSEDDLRDEDYVQDNTPAEESVYLVLAESDAGRSGVSALADDLAVGLPHSVATNAVLELGVELGVAIAPDSLPAQLPITMADGQTRLHWVEYDPAAVTQSITGLFQAKVAVAGTAFTLDLAVGTEDLASARTALTAAAERVAGARAAAQEQTPVYVYQKPAGLVLSTLDISSTAPEVAYPVHGSSELVRYLSAQLIAGEQYIDLSGFFDGWGMSSTEDIDLWDAYNEAEYQTPMALAYARTDAVYYPDEQLLAITYHDSAEQRAADQAQLDQVVQAAVAQIITPGMTEREKVTAINSYLLSVAVYDDTAYDSILGGNSDDYPQAWLPTGVLLHGAGVCVSYAMAFEALADAAGLESVMVTGTALDADEGHAWNKVRVDGVWRIVDSTWNDSPWVGSQAYFLQTDAQAAGDRAEDDLWIVDSVQPQYAAS